MRRLPIYRGSEHHRARFSPEEVADIRKSFDADQPTYRQMAKERHCGSSTIFEIVNKRSYREE